MAKIFAIIGALVTGGLVITLAGLMPHALARSCEGIPSMLTSN